MDRYGSYIALGGALLLNAAANLLVKVGMRSIHAAGGLFRDGLLGAAGLVLGQPALILGVVCFAANLACYMYALQRLHVSMAYPIMVSAGFAIIVIVAGLYLHERLNFLQWAGVVLILTGVWLVASQAGRQLPATS